ncbi:MAG: MATE family efflux transporter [Pseudomonadota bacterium]
MAPPGKFVTGSTMRHVVVMTVSGSLGLLFMFLVDFVALWWVSQLGVERLVAAVGFAWTIQFATVSVAIGMMIAAVALVSRALGRGNVARARRLATSAMVITVLVQSCVALCVFMFRDQILAVSGAQGETLDIASRFLGISIPSLPLMAVGMIASAVLRAAGDAWRAMFVTTSAGMVALVIDPLLIMVLELGVDGAAMAIVISRGTTALVGLYFVHRVHSLLAPFRLQDATRFARPYFEIALPAIATQMATPFGNWILTREIAEFGDSAVAGWGVVSRLTILAFGGIFALSGAIGGIIGQNYGAGRLDRVAQAYLDALKFCLLYTLVTWGLLFALQGPIIAGFNLSGDGAEVVRAFNSIAAGAFIFTGALFVSNAAFNNLGKPLWSTWANWARDGLLMFPLATAMGGLLAAPGVIYAQGIAGVVTGVIAAFVGWRFVQGLEGRGNRLMSTSETR